jgi:hypothetical protein
MTLPPAWQLPAADRDITATHDADITPATIYPPASGERMDLHLAIWIAFHNASITRQKAAAEAAAAAETQAALQQGQRDCGGISPGV